jgi:hypothetical protein
MRVKIKYNGLGFKQGLRARLAVLVPEKLMAQGQL